MVLQRPTYQWCCMYSTLNFKKDFTQIFNLWKQRHSLLPCKLVLWHILWKFHSIRMALLYCVVNCGIIFSRYSNYLEFLLLRSLFKHFHFCIWDNRGVYFFAFSLSTWAYGRAGSSRDKVILLNSTVNRRLYFFLIFSPNPSKNKTSWQQNQKICKKKKKTTKKWEHTQTQIQHWQGYNYVCEFQIQYVKYQQRPHNCPFDVLVSMSSFLTQ